MTNFVPFKALYRIHSLTQLKSMRKFLTLLPIAVLFFAFTPKLINAQVITEIGEFQMCYHASTAMPVVVHNMNDIDSLRLVLSFDKNVIGFVEYFALNALLAGGTFEVYNDNDSIIINWSRTSSATITSDTLVWLKFNGLVGSSVLQWNTPGSSYYTQGVNVTSIFLNGNVTVNPEIKVTLTEIDPTCVLKCDANYMANSTGGTSPYIYLWNGKPGRFDSIQTGMCSGPYLISITDSKGCKLDSLFTIEGLPAADVNLIIEGNSDTTIYLQNPVLTFSFQEISPTHVIEPPLWEFGDGDTARSFNPTHVYSRAITNTDGYYILKLFILNENGCGDTIEFKIQIKDAKLKIPGVITPNGDGFNDSFMILNENKTGSGEEIKITTEFQRMELVVFDRWGRKLFDDSNYQSDWAAKGVPDGSYYFILKTVGFYKTEIYKGSITILGSGITN